MTKLPCQSHAESAGLNCNAFDQILYLYVSFIYWYNDTCEKFDHI